MWQSLGRGVWRCGPVSDADIHIVTIVALAAVGEMGAAIGQRIVRSGGVALTCLDGRSQASIDRASTAGIEVSAFSSIMTRSEFYLSIVPPAMAEDVAETFLRSAAAADRVPIFIDCNAVAPATLERIASRFHAANLSFGDGAIIGGPPKIGDKGPRLYLSGPMQEATRQLRDVGLDARYLSPVLAQASCLKMGYAGLTKGLQALATGLLPSANEAGVLDALIAEIVQSLPGLHSFLSATLPRMSDKAARWEHEMREIANFVQSYDGVSAMFVGAADAYRSVADARSAKSAVLPEIIGRFASARS